MAPCPELVIELSFVLTDSWSRRAVPSERWLYQGHRHLSASAAHAVDAGLIGLDEFAVRFPVARKNSGNHLRLVPLHGPGISCVHARFPRRLAIATSKLAPCISRYESLFGNS
jgi:hypothetical protein